MTRKTQHYRQCSLVRETTRATLFKVSYIPACYAKVGRQLQLKDTATGQWQDGWVVDSAGPLVRAPSDPHQLIKGHRRMTGDALGRRNAH